MLLWEKMETTHMSNLFLVKSSNIACNLLLSLTVCKVPNNYSEKSRYLHFVVTFQGFKQSQNQTALVLNTARKKSVCMHTHIETSRQFQSVLTFKQLLKLIKQNKTTHLAFATSDFSFANDFSVVASGTESSLSSCKIYFWYCYLFKI